MKRNPKLKDDTLLRAHFVSFVRLCKLHEENNSMVNGKFYFNLPPLPSNDICKDVDYKTRMFGLRSDGDFWQIALLPFNYRILPLSFILEVLYGKDHELEAIPDKGPLRKKYFAEDDTQSTFLILEKLIEDDITWGMYRGPVGLAEYIKTKYHREYYLKLLPSSHPLYKQIKNFKMKKRKGFIRKKNKHALAIGRAFSKSFSS